MRAYKARQIARITDAVAAARLELRRQRRFEPLLFARIFVANGGAQIPGQPDAQDAARRLGELLLQALAEDRRTSDDADVTREIERARQESEWARALEEEGERLVGFLLQPPNHPDGHEDAWEQALKANQGLGSGIYRKYEIVVLPPQCVGGRFLPIFGGELEC